MSCENIPAKCVMLQALQRAHSSRQLGPCQFKPIGPFLLEALQDTSSAQEPVRTGVSQTVVALGDVHGDLLVLLSVLYLMGVIDADANWIGGNTLVVQCGDFVDRGGRGRATVDTSNNPREEVDIIQYVWALNRQAGGGIVSTVGNHEVAMVWLRSRFPEYRHYSLPQLAGWGGSMESKCDLWRPGGLMARYLAAYCPLVVQVNHFLFLHAGLTPGMGRMSVRHLNQVLQQAMQTPGSEFPEELDDVLHTRELGKNQANCTQDVAPALAQRLWRFSVRVGPSGSRHRGGAHGAEQHPRVLRWPGLARRPGHVRGLWRQHADRRAGDPAPGRPRHHGQARAPPGHRRQDACRREISQPVPQRRARDARRAVHGHRPPGREVACRRQQLVAQSAAMIPAFPLWVF